MNTKIDDVEVAHGQALLYEEIQDARLKSLFAEVRDMKALCAEEIEDYRKRGLLNPSDISEEAREWNQAIFDTAMRITKEATERWFMPYGGVGL